MTKSPYQNGIGFFYIQNFREEEGNAIQTKFSLQQRSNKGN
jgi:hypothetical protein